MRLQLEQCLVVLELTKMLRACSGLLAAALLDPPCPLQGIGQYLFVQMNKVVMCPLALNART